MGAELDYLTLIEINRDGKPEGNFHVAGLPKKVCQQNAEMYAKFGFAKPWIAYLALDGTRVIGTCAFKGPPKAKRVEIAYFTFPEHEGKGYGTKMVGELVAMAIKKDPSTTVFAYTLCEENASNHILKKWGFKFNGQINHPEDGMVWLWEIA